MVAKWEFPGIAYGGDYNPEQWDAETNTKDYQLMQKAGVNLVSIGIFSWAKIEPAPGEYQLEWLADIIENLYAHDIYVDLATATASPPAWMVINDTETLPQNRAGTRLGFGARQQYCPNSPYYREKAAGLVEKIADRFGKHPAIKLWHINNELGNHVPSCYCKNCETAFRKWLKRMYGSIEEVNRIWGTNFWSQTYYSFAQITPPREMPAFPNPSQKLDYRRFMSDSYLELYRIEYEIIRKYSPEVPITTNFMGLFDGVNYQKWAENVDIVADDSYPEPANSASCAAVALEADLCRSYHDAPFLLMEQAPVGAIQWRVTNSPKRPGQHRLWSLQRIAHGADGILHFQWRQSQRGAEMFHAGMVPHAGENSRIFREICHLGEELKALSGIQGCKVETPIAIIWDWESEWCRKYAVGPRRQRFAEGLRDWHRSCFEAGYVTDIISLRKNIDLAKYQVIIVPEVFLMNTYQVQLLQQAVVRGTQVLIVAPSCVVDENLGAYLENLIGPLEKLVGVRVIEHWVSSCEDKKQKIYPDDSYRPPSYKEDRITGAVGAPSVEADIYLKVEEPGMEAGLVPKMQMPEQLKVDLQRQKESTDIGDDASNKIGFCDTDKTTAVEEINLKARYWAELFEIKVGEEQNRLQQLDTPCALEDKTKSGNNTSQQEVSNGLDIMSVVNADRTATTGNPEGEYPEILATYAKIGAAKDIAGHPAFVRRKIGAGSAWYLSTNLDPAGRHKVLKSICEKAQIKPPIADFLEQIKSDGNYPPGLEIVDRGSYRFLLNHGDNTIQLEGVAAFEVIHKTNIRGTILLNPRDVLVLKKHI